MRLMTVAAPICLGLPPVQGMPNFGLGVDSCSVVWDCPPSKGCQTAGSTAYDAASGLGLPPVQGMPNCFGLLTSRWRRVWDCPPSKGCQTTGLEYSNMVSVWDCPPSKGCHTQKLNMKRCPNRFGIAPRPRDATLVSGQLKADRAGHLKSGHFEGRIAFGAADAAQRRDESTQNEPATVHHYLVAARVVLPADRTGTATAPGDGFQIRPATRGGGFKTGQSAHRLDGCGGARTGQSARRRFGASRSQCEPWREALEQGWQAGLSAQRLYQDLVADQQFAAATMR